METQIKTAEPEELNEAALDFMDSFMDGCQDIMAYCLYVKLNRKNYRTLHLVQDACPFFMQIFRERGNYGTE